MITWAAVVTSITGALASIGDWSSMLLNIAEIGGVVALFTLVCAAEVFSEPRN
jgi:hypothetical protein